MKPCIKCLFHYFPCKSQCLIVEYKSIYTHSTGYKNSLWLTVGYTKKSTFSNPKLAESSTTFYAFCTLKCKLVIAKEIVGAHLRYNLDESNITAKYIIPSFIGLIDFIREKKLNSLYYKQFVDQITPFDTS